MVDEELGQDIGADSDNESAMSQISTALMAAKILERCREDGVPMNELSLDVQGGKIRAVTQREKKASDELRRKELIKKLRQRSIRGDNSLAEDISRRLRRCQEWIDYISRFSSVTEKELLNIRRNLESMNNRATSLVKEVTVLEMAIQRKKEEDPVISKMENASVELMEAMKNREFDRVAEIRQFCEQNVSAYNLRKKRLKPYFTQARQARLKFLSEKRQVMRMQFDTGGQVAELLAQDLSTGKFSQFDEESMKVTTSLVHELRSLRTEARPLIEKISQPVANVALSFLSDIENDMAVIDESVINPFEEKVDLLMATVGNALKQIREELAKQKDESKEPSNRMAFQQKKEDGSR